jgi:hypothetical protein
MYNPLSVRMAHRRFWNQGAFMTPEEVRLSQTLPAARTKLEQLATVGRFPDLKGPIDGLREALDYLHSNERWTEEDAVNVATGSVTQLYRTSMSQANAAPQKYQQPVFQCYTDYEKCIAKQATISGKALCVTLFALSLADSLLSISIKI